MENWWQIGKNGRTLFDRPKPTMGCSADGRRRNALLWTVECAASEGEVLQNLARINVYSEETE